MKKCCRAVPNVGWRNHPPHLDGRAGMERGELRHYRGFPKQSRMRSEVRRHKQACQGPAARSPSIPESIALLVFTVGRMRAPA